ncbi:MAG: hypothetical protein MUF51_04245 [Vicinamibacteria bacterium]|jgi:hypothetical protein|nr:hypothetical protein [Vicinamibacteria bacterium]
MRVSIRYLKSAFRECSLIAIFALLAVAHTGLFDDLATRYFIGVDPTQDVWALNWVARHLTTAPGAIFEGNNYFPATHAILYAEPLLGPSLLAQPFFWLGAGPVLLYNLTLLTVVTALGYSSYRAALALTGNRLAALVAGVAIPGSGQYTGHFGQMNIISTAGLPLLIVSLPRLARRPGILAATGTVMGFLFGALSSGYHAINGALLIVVIGLWEWRTWHKRSLLWASGAGCAIALLMAPYVMSFRQLDFEKMTRDDMASWIETVSSMSMSLPDTLLRSQSFVWGRLLDNQRDPMFPGLIIIALACLGLWRNKARSAARLLALIVIVFGILSLGPQLMIQGRAICALPTKLLYLYVFPFNHVRHPTTFLAPALIALGLLGALGATSLRARWAALCAIAIVAETLAWPPMPPRAPRPPVPAIYDLARRLPSGGILDYPVGHDSDWQWFSTHHGLPIVGGFSRFCPQRLPALYRLIRKEWGQDGGPSLEESASVRYLKRFFPVRYLVLHRRGMGWTSRSIEATPKTFELVAEQDGDRLYRIHRGGRDRRFLRCFREDQLARGIRLRLIGAREQRLAIRLEERPLREWTCDGRVQIVELDTLRASCAHDLCTVTLESDAPFELIDIEDR